jgi:lipoprotein-releasing system permease protein
VGQVVSPAACPTTCHADTHLKQFELFIALRYLRAKRKQAVISVITMISIVGVAAGVMALVIALAITTGFSHTLQKNLLGVYAHVNVMDKNGNGIDNWRELRQKFLSIPHVIGASPALFAVVFATGPKQSAGISLQGIDVGSELTVSDTLRHLKEGSLDRLKTRGPLPGIILGSRLSQEIGMPLNSIVTVVSPQGTLTPYGPIPSNRKFRVVGIFESGFYDFDARWAYTSLDVAQEAMSLEDVVNSIELKLDNLELAPQVAKAAERIGGPNLAAQTWMDQNRPLFHALEIEKLVTVVTISLIELVAALNILIALVMMVMEKYRDIAVLMSMGAKREQIGNIFMLQGLLIGVVGSAAGLAAGYTICYFADRYRWLRLNDQIYALSYVPFEAHAIHGVWIAAAAILVSFLATIYPARSATRIVPAEVLRYE